MSDIITYNIGKKILQADAILNYLKDIDTDFSPPLSQKVTLSKYALKLFEHAFFVTAESVNDLPGLCAFYMNANTATAFITLIHVKKDYRGKGIAGRLLFEMMNQLHQNNMSFLDLEVTKNNHQAINFYTHHGFIVHEDKNESLIMRKII